MPRKAKGQPPKGTNRGRNSGGYGDSESPANTSSSGSSTESAQGLAVHPPIQQNMVQQPGLLGAQIPTHALPQFNMFPNMLGGFSLPVNAEPQIWQTPRRAAPYGDPPRKRGRPPRQRPQEYVPPPMLVAPFVAPPNQNNSVHLECLNNYFNLLNVSTAQERAEAEARRQQEALRQFQEARRRAEESQRAALEMARQQQAVYWNMMVQNPNLMMNIPQPGFPTFPQMLVAQAQMFNYQPFPIPGLMFPQMAQPTAVIQYAAAQAAPAAPRVVEPQVEQPRAASAFQPYRPPTPTPPPAQNLGANMFAFPPELQKMIDQLGKK
uniref:Uncharacterized protein n=1 Tax=Caenorhabditis tropicalis TaxID=1561998 RepID=A0A1I7T1Z3_9PELO